MRDRETSQSLLKGLLAAMAGGRLLGPDAFAPGAAQILRLREAPEFEAKLVPRLNAVLEIARSTQRGECEYIEDFVEDVFAHVFKLTESDDLSAYVSDDFGMLAQALHVGYEDHWLNGLLEAYAQGKVPCGPIRELPGSLVDQVRKLAHE